MQERNLLIVNFVVFQLILMILGNFQSSAWFYQGNSPAPQLWLLPLLYFGIYRNFMAGLVYCYVAPAVLGMVTGASYGFLLCLHILIFLASRFFKTRIFWSDLSYHILMCGLFVFVSGLLAWLLSISFDANPMVGLPIWGILGSALLTAIVGPLLLSGFLKLDRAMGQDIVLLTGMKVQ